MECCRRRQTASAALPLPGAKDVLDKLGIAIGDEVELSLIDRTLMLQPLDEAARGQQLAAITNIVFARRQSAYTQLAQGPE
jgi:antitoxin component of MazEF toxin-antitoxin module